MTAAEIVTAVETHLDDCAALGDSAEVDKLGVVLSFLAQAAHARAAGIARRRYGDIAAATTWERTAEGFIAQARRVL